MEKYIWRQNMRIDSLSISQFKNLKDFHIDIDETQLTSVFIGQNGAGKSNLLEAIVIIFRDLDLNVPTIEFSYEIQYKCKDNAVIVKSDCAEGKRTFIVNGEKYTRSSFYKERER